MNLEKLQLYFFILKKYIIQNNKINLNIKNINKLFNLKNIIMGC